MPRRQTCSRSRASLEIIHAVLGGSGRSQRQSSSIRKDVSWQPSHKAVVSESPPRSILRNSEDQLSRILLGGLACRGGSPSKDGRQMRLTRGEVGKMQGPVGKAASAPTAGNAHVGGSSSRSQWQRVMPSRMVRYMGPYLIFGPLLFFFCFYGKVGVFGGLAFLPRLRL